MKSINFHPVEVDCRFLDLVDALFNAEEGRFVGIGQNGHNDVLKKPISPLDNIKVAVGQGVKTARVERNQKI